MKRQRLATVGLVAVLTIVLGGCGFFAKTGLETVNRNEGFQLRSVERGDEGKGMETDDWYAKVAQQVPAFGGLFFDEMGQLTVYLTDTAPDVAAAAEAAIRSVFGDDERMTVPNPCAPW